jgi:peptidoglycan/LPS O-acetylase OafA/YrhL
MEWLQRHAWQLLLAMTALIAVIGLNPVKDGINEDPSVPLGLAGMTAAQLEADNAQSFRLIDVQARFGGLDLIVIGLLLSAILVGAFRHNERWSWWAMWLLPLWGVSVFATILRTGVAADQAPPSPYFSGPIIAALSSALLIVAAPRFFGRRTAGDAATVPATGG